MQSDIDRILISRDEIQQRLDQLADEIAADLRGEQDGGAPAEITLVPILTGSMIMVSDLMRRLPLRMQIHLVSVTSYPGEATTSRGAAIEEALTSLPDSLESRHVVIVDDILDSGATLELVTSLLRRRRPASLRSCVLLRKQREQPPSVEADYVAFAIPDEFVVGYGLDFDDYYRNLPDIVTLRRDLLPPEEPA
ncbi:MAG: hypoxanthine phosphoribosyltransferase [Phycisphaeraceae bacterium]